MTRKVSNFSDLIQRVTTSCFLHSFADDREEEYHSDSFGNKPQDEQGYYGEEKMVMGLKVISREEKKLKQMRALMEEVFEAVSAMKSAYVSLQEAHCTWDPQSLREADVAVVAQLKKLALLRDGFHGSVSTVEEDEGRRRRGGNAPYETVMKKEVKAKDLHKVKLGCVATLTSHENKARRPHPYTKRKLGCNSQMQEAGFVAAPSPEVLEATMAQVKEASKSFTSLLLSLMQDAKWDMAAAVRSIEAASDKYYNNPATSTTTVSTLHAKYALESYIFRKMFQGFDHESFYMDNNTLSSLLNPAQFRRDCFSQYHDMKSTDPSELLGVLPTCHFGKFCSNKYLSVVHPKMEESLFGDLVQHSLVSEGNHPRTRFYKEFLGVAKEVWLLHLLAFSFDPLPSKFEASGGAEFHPRYMETVVKFAGGRVPPGTVVGFSVSPGFKFRNGSVVKARVYLMARN
ncbi:Protein GRAVITROPIC IN THE LIGHT 1 [Glycine max]|nr:Protein GRAVITROPIC IN THE LIGHT 1 [Glycine max]